MWSFFPSQKMSVMQGACAFTGKGSHVVGMDGPDPHYCCYKGNIIVVLIYIYMEPQIPCDAATGVVVFVW